ncbi:hypothetical protein KEM09_11900 [Carboxylicivirga mesophila]|uniref:ABC transporter permease n=1 Tax=Carboxylicivirga mesophila TaxID=1166478 RepID=A0ABS5KB60_9BACT|nr:hypothetical protein [Carboxylicivirga mesophila]MBS2212112.1 hypothetical protein [Carboxylicivirga mesophila]
MTVIQRILSAPLNIFLSLLGVNERHFKVLLAAKLKMDFRRPPNSFQSAGKKQTLIKQLFIYAFLGAIMLLSLYRIPDLMLQLSVFYAFLIVFAGTIMLTEFTSVLFDESENHVLLPRPVSSRTLLIVRLIHVLIYIGNITLSLSLPFSIYLAINYGFIALAFLLGVFLCAWFIMLLVVGIYMSLSRLVSASRFKDVLNYLQIGLAIIIMASYQLVPNFIEDANMEQLTFTHAWWTQLVPSVWFAGFVRFLSGMGEGNDVVLFLITIGVTILESVILVRTLSSGFNAIIAESGAGTVTKKKEVIKVNAKQPWLEKVIDLLCVSSVEKMGWAFTMSHIKSDRKLKQQLYPMFAYSIIMVIVFLKPQVNNFGAYMAELGQSSKYLMFFLAGFFGTIGISIIPYTDTPKAAWIYEVASTNKKYHMQSGAIKAVLFTFFLPLYVLYLVPIIWIWGVSVLPHIILGASLSAALAILLVKLQKQPLPFSQAREMVNKGEYTLKMLLGMAMVGVIIGLVYLVSLAHIGLSIGLCVMMPFIIVLCYRLIRSQKVAIRV